MLLIVLKYFREGSANSMDISEARTVTEAVIESIQKAPVPAKLALFGLSANPPTYAHGHNGIVRTLIHSGDYSHVLILPVYEHIFSKKLVPFEHRVKMCELCFGGLSTPSCTVHVLPLEQVVAEEMSITRPDQRVGTIDIVDYLLTHIDKPDVEIHLVLGKDTFRDLINRKWKDSDRLLRSVFLEVFYREGVDLQLTDEQTATYKVSEHRILDLPGELLNVCSTRVREYFHDGQDDLAEQMLHPAVFAYIREHGLYRSEGESVLDNNNNNLVNAAVNL